MAVAKQATTIATHTALDTFDLAVEICTRPWIVELSRNSLKVAAAILNHVKLNGMVMVKTGCLRFMLIFVRDYMAKA